MSAEEGFGYLYGTLLVVVGCTIDNVGITLQKVAHKKQEQDAIRKQYCSDIKWIIGLAMYLVGNIINAIGLGMCSQSLFAALGSISLVVNVFTSKFILKEEASKRIILGTVIIIVGSSLAVWFGDHSTEAYNLDILIAYLSNPIFIAYFVSLILLIFLTVMLIRVLNKRNSFFAFENSNSEIHQSDSSAEEFRIHNSVHEQTAKHCLLFPQTLLCILYPSLAGMIGSITLLSAKFFAEIVKSLFKGNNEFTKFPVYLSGILVLSLGALQIHILNLGLKRFDQIIVIPAFSVVLEIFSIIIGIIYFQQYSNFDLAQSIMFPASIAFTFIGVYMIAKGKKEQQKEQIVNSNSSQNV